MHRLTPTAEVAWEIVLVLSVPLIFRGLGRDGVVGVGEAFHQDVAIDSLESGDCCRIRS